MMMMTDSMNQNKFIKTFKNLWNKLQVFYNKHTYIINAWAIIITVIFIMIAIATRWFSDPNTVFDKVSSGSANGITYYHYNQTAINIGIPVQWYALFIMFGIISSVILAIPEFKKRQLDPNMIIDGLLLCLPVAIIGARLYFVFDNWGDGWDFMRIIGWNGSGFELSGLAINGAMVAVVIVLIPFCYLRKVNFLVLLDIVLPAFLIGQLIGRWGNFMNHELYGPAISSESYKNFLPDFITNQLTIRPETARIGLQEGARHPVFLYESMLNFFGFVMIAFLRDKKIFKIGDLACLYLIWYGVVRGAVIEPLRYFGGNIGDSMLMYFGDTEFPINVFFSIIMVIAGLALIFGRRLVFKKNPQPYYSEYLGKKRIKFVKQSTINGDEK